jgi:hypothetical protein
MSGSIIAANYGDEYIVNKGYFCGGKINFHSISTDHAESLSMLMCFYKDCSSPLTLPNSIGDRVYKVVPINSDFESSAGTVLYN